MVSLVEYLPMKLENHLFIDLNRLRQENVEEFEVALDPSIMELDPADNIKVTEPVEVQGRAYIADDELIVELDVEGVLEIHCAMCHEPFDYQVSVVNYVHNQPVSEIKHSTFDAKELVREAFLLEIPLFPQCGGNECENRDKIAKYLKQEGSAEEASQSPFKDL